MTLARKEIVEARVGGTYHCWSHCVRRAFICGICKLTGRNYEHRKGWVKTRLVELSQIFAIDVLAYAIMDNHNHLALRNHPQIAFKWSADEVARRWLQLFPKKRGRDGASAEPSKEQIAAICCSPERVEQLRLRLCDVSWFMRCLKENIAIRANREDDVTGHFWEGRFKCTRLDDPGAVLSCMVYIDLNPIRAGKAKTPEESNYTSAFERICKRELSTNKSASHQSTTEDQEKDNEWLCAIEEIFCSTKLSLDEYLVILDETGRILIEGKKGCIAENINPILERLSIKAENWQTTSSRFGRLFPRVSAHGDFK